MIFKQVLISLHSPLGGGGCWRVCFTKSIQDNNKMQREDQLLKYVLEENHRQLTADRSTSYV